MVVAVIVLLATTRIGPDHGRERVHRRRVDRPGRKPPLAGPGDGLRRTSLFTEFITNNAAAILVFPIAMATADRLDVSYMPFIMSIMIAASASFATPIGYQTNLMVYGPGGYRFSDFLRIGLPLNLLMWTITVALAPLIWKF